MRKPRKRRLSVAQASLTLEHSVADTLQAIANEVKNIHDPLLRDQYRYAIEEVSKDGDLEHMLVLARYKRGIVPLDEFLHSATYMGLPPDELYPGVIETLNALETEQYVECVLKGGIGGGKTVTANLSIIRQLYKLSCMRSPQQTFGVQKHSSIVFTIQSVRLTTAKKAVFDEMVPFLENSPYFREVYPFDRRITSSLIFRQQRVSILPVSSSDTGAISMNVIGGLLDEVNFMERIKNSKNSGAADGGDYDQAKTLYLNLSKRRRSRFMHRGRLPGTLFLVSSSRYPDDFTEEKAKEATMCGGDDPTIYVSSKSLWASKGRDNYSPQSFRVLVGNERIRSRILAADDKYVPTDSSTIIEVPADFRLDFEKDIDGSIRDLAGLTTLATHPFIQNRESLFKCMENADRYAYQSYIPVEDIDLEVSLPTAIESRVRTDVPTMRVAHIDLGLTNDSAGLAIGHIAGVKAVTRRDSDTGKTTVEVLPVVGFDLILRIMPPRDGQIDFAKIRQILYTARDILGLPLKVVSTDGFQCIAGDTKVWTARGMITAQEVVEGDIVQSRIGPRPVTKKFSFGKRKTLRVTTADGHSITATLKHKLEVSSLKRLGGDATWQWKKVKNIEIGDILHTWDGVTEVNPPSNGLTTLLATLYGVIYGDGDITTDGICISCAAHEINYAYEILRANVGGAVSVDYGRCTIRHSSREFVRTMLSQGFDKKHIPSMLTSAPIEVQSAFLSGLFATGGSVKARDGQPSLSTKHRWLVDYVRDFLRMAHGIATDTTIIDRSIYYEGTFNTAAPYQYIVSIKGSRRHFHDCVGFAYRNKQERLAQHIDIKGRRIGSKVVSIEPCYADVYDFEVAEDHSYIANGIVSHNSADFKQILAKKGFATEYVSLDRNTLPYRTLRDALYDERVLLPRHQTLIKELTELEYVRHRAKEKVDHRANGSKDVADAVCGVVSYLMSRRSTWSTQPTFKAAGGLVLHGHRTGTTEVLDELTSDEVAAAYSVGVRRATVRRKASRVPRRKRKSMP